MFLWLEQKKVIEETRAVNDTGETVTLMGAEDKVLDTFDAPKGTVIDDNATAVETDYSTEDSTEDSTEANNESSVMIERIRQKRTPRR